MQIPLTQNKFAIIDNEDIGLIDQYSWHTCKDKNNYYAKSKVRLDNGKQTTIAMHRLILKTPKGVISDHINNDGLDNRRTNLRIATHSQNNANQRKILKRSSQYKGVCWDKIKRKWQANIRFNDKGIFLGYFQKEEEGARAYNKAAIYFFGEFAKINIIP